MVVEKPKPRSSKRLFFPWLYDLFLWACTLCLNIFFREIQTRASYRVPKKGPLIIVAGPHANQFVDSIILMRVLKNLPGRRLSFLIAEKSMKEPFIGTMAKLCGALPVARAMDNVKPGKGTLLLPKPEEDATLLQGVGTDFTHPMFAVGASVVFPKVGKTNPATGTIAEVLGPKELRLKKAVDIPQELLNAMTVEGSEASEGVSYKVAPHIDQSKLFDAASSHLLGGGCIGIFPEGGSHDRPGLLPLKAGVSIMALHASSLDPDCGLTIIPCGMNYFHAHKFRSRAVVEFGTAVDVHPDQIEAFKKGGSQRRNAVSSLLETINESLIAVTQASPDYDTTMLVQATRRLYNPIGEKLPLSAVVEVNRRLIRGYQEFKDDKRVIELGKNIRAYNQRLRNLGIKDHQIEWGDTEKRPWWLTLSTLLYRIGELLILFVGTLPGLLLFWPVFVVSKLISKKKQERALANSEVKLQGRDVVGTWKLLVSAVLTPALYLWYTYILTFWLHNNRTGGYYTQQSPRWLRIRTYVPDAISLSQFAFSCLVLLVVVTFAALRTGEIGMDIVKSFPPLLVALNPFTSSYFSKLRVRRQALAAEVTDVINTLGPQIFENFDRDRIIADPYAKKDAYQSSLKRTDVDSERSNDHRRERSLSLDSNLSSPFQFSSADEDDEIDESSSSS